MTAPPMLIVLNGLPGAGKTTTARTIAKATDTEHLCSDDLRREFFVGTELAMSQFLPSGNRIVYELIFQRAEIQLLAGRSVISDGMNNLPAGWTRYLSLAERMRVGLVFLDILVPTHVLRSRLLARQQTGSSSSLGNQAVLETIIALGSHNWISNDPKPSVNGAIVRWSQIDNRLLLIHSGDGIHTAAASLVAKFLGLPLLRSFDARDIPDETH